MNNRGRIAVVVVLLLLFVGARMLRRRGGDHVPLVPPSTPGAPVPKAAGTPAAAPSTAPMASSPAPAKPAAEAPPKAPQPATLIVRDAATKAAIAGARVFAHTPGADCGVELDTRPDIGVDTTPDPRCIAFPALGRTDGGGRLVVVVADPLQIHVVADGYRWGRTFTGEEGVVAELVPGGAVHLVVTRWGELEEAVVLAVPGAVGEGVDPTVPAAILEVEDDAGHTFVAPGTFRTPGLKPGSDDVRIDGIEPGTWTVFVRRGNHEGEIYGRGVVTVTAGTIAELRIDAVPTTGGPRWPVKVVVHIPTAWVMPEHYEKTDYGGSGYIDPSGPMFVLKGLDPHNRHLEATGNPARRHDDGVDRATLDPPLPAGRYRATVQPPGWVVEVEVQGPAPEVHIELPEPGTVHVTLLDRATGKPVPGGWVRWAPPWKDLGRGHMETVSTGEKTGCVFLGSPPGTVHADLGAEGYLDAQTEFSFVAGTTSEVEVTLRAAAVVVVHLRVDGKPYEGQSSVEVVLKVEDEEMSRLYGESETGGVVTSVSTSGGGAEHSLGGLWAGPHEITISGLEGFEEVPPRRVELRFGVTTEVEFDLVRVK